MNESTIPAAILDSIPFSIVFADPGHVIRYMNAAGKKKYARWGDIIGKSLFHCHNENSQHLIREYVARLLAGEDEILFIDKPSHRVYLRSLRDGSGTLTGYYEMYGPPAENFSDV